MSCVKNELIKMVWKSVTGKQPRNVIFSGLHFKQQGYKDVFQGAFWIDSLCVGPPVCLG